MSSGQLKTVVRHIHKLAGVPEGADQTDAQLLERFVRRREEEVFAILVERHGPMVMGVCRRVLQNVHDAEDAFQAVFLILARKVDSLRQPHTLGCWLHEVALRTAVRARSRALTRRQHEGRVVTMAQQDSLETIVWRDLQPILDEEVQRLPKLYRAAFVLCYMEGKTYEQTATQLGCRTGTISRRLARARELLQQRLTRRGLSLPAGLLAAVLSQYVLPGAVSASLLSTTVSAALTGIAGTTAGSGLSAQAAVLAEEGIKTMVLGKSRLLLSGLLLVGLLGTGLLLACQALADRPNPRESADCRLQIADLPEKGTSSDKSAISNLKSEIRRVPVGTAGVQKMVTFRGKVLDAKVRPVGNAFVAFLGRLKPRGPLYPELSFPQVLAQGQADNTGEFQLAVPRVAAADFWELNLVAWGPGHALGVKRVSSDPRDSRWLILLAKEQVLQGRLMDLQGQPAAGVKIHITHLEGMGSVFQGQQSIEFGAPPTALKAWPGPVTTGADGRFTLHGVGPDWMAVLAIGDNQFAAQKLVVNPSGTLKYILDQNQRMGRPSPSVQLAGKTPQQPFTWIGLPAQVLEGTVTHADTGKPVAHARVVVFASRQSFSAVDDDRVTGQTDAAGKYRLVPKTGDHFVVLVYPPEKEPYLMRTRRFVWKDSAALNRTEDFALPRGVLIEGTITETPSGKPVADALVEYFANPKDNPFLTRSDIPILNNQKQLGKSGADGKFQIPVPPGKGHLLIITPAQKYVRAKLSPVDLGANGFPLNWHYPQGWVKLDLKPGTRSFPVKVALRLGFTVPVRLVSPQGQPVRDTLVISRAHIPHGYTQEYAQPQPRKESEFDLPGLDPNGDNVVYLFSAEKQLGLQLKLTAADADRRPLTVKLQPAGAARVRLVDAQGKLRKGWKPGVELVITPGPSAFTFNPAQIAAEAIPMGNLDPFRYGLLQSDAQGRFTLPSLIPGATYHVYVQSDQGFQYGTDRTFTVEPGQTLDLGDLAVKTSQP